MFRVLAFIVCAGIVGAVGYAATQPDTFVVSRAQRIKAPPEAIFPLVSDFGRWQEWSPWVAKDPSIAVTLSPRTTGMGATYQWRGNQDVGAGRMAITSVKAPTDLGISLVIEEPFPANNQAEFYLEPIGDYTKITWRVSGPMSFGAKLMNLFMSMDSVIGPDFKQGLENLRDRVESE